MPPAGHSRRVAIGAGSLAVLLGALSLLTSCMVGPDYVRPTIDVGVQFKETPGWKPAQPQLAEVPSGAWWLMYGDATLNQLMQELNVANQNIAQAEARFRQAVALTQGSRAPLLPTVSATGGATRAGGSATGPPAFLSRPADLGAQVITEALKRAKVAPADVEHVIMGQVDRKSVV